MSTKREPLLSDELINYSCFSNVMATSREREIAKNAMEDVRSMYEAARAKDAERIEQLEALCRAVGNGLDEMMRPANRECDGAHCTGCWKDINGHLVKLLFAAGFKPSEPCHAPSAK